MRRIYAQWMLLALLTLALSLTASCALAQVKVDWVEETAGNSRLYYPAVSGLEDEIAQGKVNMAIEMGLSVENARLTLERIRARGGESEGERALWMDASIYQKDQLLSIAVTRRGEQADGSLGESVTAMVFDLSTGERITMDALFQDAPAAYAKMESIIETEILGELNTYMENADLLPMPRDQFYVDALGVTVFYPSERYSLFSGSAGACQFYFYELEELLDRESELGKSLFVQNQPADPAKDIRAAIASGAFPNWTSNVRLGEPVGAYLDAYTLLTDPDYTLESRVYLFEEPQLRGMSLETWLYAECEEEEAPLTAIRAQRIDLYGIRPGITTLAECEQLLGEPDSRTTRDADDAVDMMLEPGDSLWYISGGNTLEIHADEGGVVSCLILYDGEKKA